METFTQTPNFVFDLMAKLSPAEFKVLMVIVRNTCGHHDEWARISFSLFVEMTGLTRQGVFNCVKSLTEAGHIEHREVKNAFEYRLSPFNSVEQSTPEEAATELNKSCNSVEQSENVVQLSRTSSFNSVDPLNKKEKEQTTLPIADAIPVVAKPKRKAKPQEPPEVRERRHGLFAAWVEATEARNFVKVQANAGIADLDKAGCSEGELVGCVRWMKTDPYWQDRSIYPQSVFKKLDEYRRFAKRMNGHVSGTSSWARAFAEQEETEVARRMRERGAL